MKTGIRIRGDRPVAPSSFRLMPPTAGIYIHWPFCRSRCAYCHFLSEASASPSWMERYAQALLMEISEGRVPPEYDSFWFDSIYWGGGTPSLVPSDVLTDALCRLRKRFRFLDPVEVTLEVNPDSVEDHCLLKWKEIGVNRISLGIQSFRNKELQRIGRRHTGAQAMEAYHTIRQAGFNNVSCDLIAGLPGQSLTYWKKNLERLLALKPEHLSLYLLEVSEETPLGKQVHRGEITLPTEKQVVSMYNAAMTACEQMGYRHYEISNWCHPGFASRHNCKYWEGRPVLGFGAGSHYAVDRLRFRNASSTEGYIRRVGESRSGLEEVERLDEQTWLAEYALMALRLRQGICLPEFRQRYGFSFEERYAEVIERYCRWGFLEIQEGWLRLTQSALIVSNEVFQEFLAPQDPGSVDSRRRPAGKGKEVT